MSLILSSGKQDLVLQRPVLNSAGMLGFSDELRADISLDGLGALITHPITLHPRTPARGERLVRYKGGLLMHTGLPNPGLYRVIEEHRLRWRRLPCPIVLHLVASHPDEMSAMVEHLDGLDEVHGLEVGLLNEDPQTDLRTLGAACKSQLPVLARLPLGVHGDRIWATEEAGAAGVVLGPPRGTLFSGGEAITGRLYGPSLLPQMMDAVLRYAAILSIPFIAGVGITTRSDAETLLNAGAAAVQLDTLLWTDPGALLESPLEFPDPPYNRWI